MQVSVDCGLSHFRLYYERSKRSMHQDVMEIQERLIYGRIGLLDNHCGTDEFGDGAC